MATTQPSHDIQITQLTGNIGAQLTGVNADAGLSDEAIHTIRQAVLRHKVVFLRAQNLDYDRQVAFARRFGELTLGHPIFSGPAERPFVREFDSRDGIRANHWHTDLTFLDRPPALALLHSLVVPPAGGDTLWANAVTAYASMPTELRELADRLRIIHSNNSDYTDATIGHRRREYLSTVYETEHPAVHLHPETGERALIIGGFAARIPGFSPRASRDIIGALQEYATRPEHTVRWAWRVGDLAIWDNRATQHYAVLDYGTEHRRNERVTVAGGVLIGVDGRASVVLSGATAAYQGDVGQAEGPSPIHAAAPQASEAGA